MKRRIGIMLALSAVLALTVAYFVAFIPPQTRRIPSKTDVNGERFEELYKSARKELGLFSGLFTLNHITVTFFIAGEQTDVPSVQFGFCHTAVINELYDAYLADFEKDAVSYTYMREEPKGIANELHFPRIEVSAAAQDGLTRFMTSDSQNIRKWVQAFAAENGWKDGTIELTITAKEDGSILYEAETV